MEWYDKYFLFMLYSMHISMSYDTCIPYIFSYIQYYVTLFPALLSTFSSVPWFISFPHPNCSSNSLLYGRELSTLHKNNLASYFPPPYYLIIWFILFKMLHHGFTSDDNNMNEKPVLGLQFHWVLERRPANIN